MMTSSFSTNSLVTRSSPTTAGMPRERAVIAVCEVLLPTSVANPRTGLFNICAVSAGERACAITITGARMADQHRVLEESRRDGEDLVMVRCVILDAVPDRVDLLLGAGHRAEKRADLIP